MVKGKHVVLLDGIRQSLDVVGIFVGLLYKLAITFRVVAFVELLNQPADVSQPTRDLANGWVFLFEAVDAKKFALTEHSVSDIQHDLVSILNVLRDVVLNKIVRYRKSLRPLSHIPLRQCEGRQIWERNSIDDGRQSHYATSRILKSSKLPAVSLASLTSSL